MKKAKKGSFRGIKFNCVDNKTEFGRRVALHEFPQFDTPYAQDMGKKQFVYVIPCWIAGPSWEKDRDDLIKACNTKGTGKLIHPNFGELEVQPGACSCTENHQESFGKVDFELTFYESNKTKWKRVTVAPKTKIKLSAFSRIMAMLGKFQTIFYKLKMLPAYATSYVSGMISSLTSGLDISNLMSSHNALQTLFGVDLKNPLNVIVGMTGFLSTYNNDYSSNGTKTAVSNDTLVQVIPDTDTQTNKVTPFSAYTTYMDIIDIPITHITPNSSATLTQYEVGIMTEIMFKSIAIIEASVAVSEIDFTSLEQAQSIWNRLLDRFDWLIKLCADHKLDDFYLELKKQRSLVVEDIQDRAPALAKLIYLDIATATPSLVMAWEQYEDLSRDIEIVERNKVQHPGFILGSRIEILDV